MKWSMSAQTHVALSAIAETISARTGVRDRDRGTVRGASRVAACRLRECIRNSTDFCPSVLPTRLTRSNSPLSPRPTSVLSLAKGLA